MRELRIESLHAGGFSDTISERLSHQLLFFTKDRFLTQSWGVGSTPCNGMAVKPRATNLAHQSALQIRRVSDQRLARREASSMG